jgi:biopolymer transport protein ExbD
MDMDFERSSRRVVNLPLTPLIDVMFILIIFFMLTTTFMHVESLELNLPSVSPKPAEKTDVMHLFIQADGAMLLGKRRLDQQELTESLSRMFQKDPNTKIMLLTAEGVTMQQLVNVMDNIYQVGGRSLFVRKWEAAPAEAMVKPADAAADATAAPAVAAPAAVVAAPAPAAGGH